MSSCKVILFFAAVLILALSVQSQARELCQRPKTSFESAKHVHDYLECLKSQTTRYGKRAYSHPLLAKLRPDVYNDYENWPQYYDMFSTEN